MDFLQIKEIVQSMRRRHSSKDASSVSMLQRYVWNCNDRGSEVTDAKSKITETKNNS